MLLCSWYNGKSVKTSSPPGCLCVWTCGRFQILSCLSNRVSEDVTLTEHLHGRLSLLSDPLLKKMDVWYSIIVICSSKPVFFFGGVSNLDISRLDVEVDSLWRSVSVGLLPNVPASAQAWWPSLNPQGPSEPPEHEWTLIARQTWCCKTFGRFTLHELFRI